MGGEQQPLAQECFTPASGNPRLAEDDRVSLRGLVAVYKGPLENWFRSACLYRVCFSMKRLGSTCLIKLASATGKHIPELQSKNSFPAYLPRYAINSRIFSGGLREQEVSTSLLDSNLPQALSTLEMPLLSACG